MIDKSLFLVLMLLFNLSLAQDNVGKDKDLKDLVKDNIDKSNLNQKYKDQLKEEVDNTSKKLKKAGNKIYKANENDPHLKQLMDEIKNNYDEDENSFKIKNLDQIKSDLEEKKDIFLKRYRKKKIINKQQNSKIILNKKSKDSGVKYRSKIITENQMLEERESSSILWGSFILMFVSLLVLVIIKVRKF